MASEYDFSGGVRGTHAAAAAQGYEIVIHDGDDERRVHVSAADLRRSQAARADRQRASGRTARGKPRLLAAERLKYTVVYEVSANGYSAYVPNLPGCVAAAKTKAETRRLIREAIQMHLEAMREAGEPIPEPETSAELVEL